LRLRGWDLFISSCTDNTITYHIYFTNPLFAILGAAYGVVAAESEPATVGSPSPLFGIVGAQRLGRYTA
jgi:hypothetical protein